jgi:heme-degrading monooxygenase HmoA
VIVREWRASASEESAELYRRHFRDAVFPQLRRLEGFVAATLLSRPIDGRIELVVLTRWTSVESIRGFAGPDIGHAVVEPAAASALLSYDRNVQHYHVLEEGVAFHQGIRSMT